jgi:thiamine pyrophosphokinase
LYAVENIGNKADIGLMISRRAILFTGGLGPDYEVVKKIIENRDIIVAADSGWDLAAGMGIIPDYYIGDMDSIYDHDGLSALPAERIMKHPVDKDFTDTELALKFLEDNNYRDIVLIGGGGGRIDHLMALISLFNREYKPSEWFTATEHIIYADKDCTLDCNTGQTVSVFSCGLCESEVSTAGLKWELKEYRIGPMQFSISNTALKNCVTVKIHSGSVLLMLNY